MAAARPGDPDAVEPPAGPAGGGAEPQGADAALDAAIDDALAELARDHPSGGPGDQPDGSPESARAQSERWRRSRAGLRSAMHTISARVVSERALAASEEAAAGAEAAPAAAAGQGRVTGRRASPFEWGFLGGLGVLIAYITFLVLDSIRDTLLLIAIATLLAIGLDPLVSMMTRRGLRRGAGVAVVFLGLLAVIAAAVYAIIPPIVNEVGSFINSVPVLITNLQTNETIRDLDQRFGVLDALRNSNIVQNVGSGAAGGILSAGFTVATVFADLLIVLILTLYLLAGFHRIKAAAYRLVPASRRARVMDLSDRILKQMGGYLSGATIIALQAGLVAGVFSAIIGLPYPWAIALGAAVLDFIPVVGPIIVGVSITLIGFTQGLAIGIISGTFYLCQHLFEAYWLYPRVMRRTVNISTGGVVVAILIGAALLGVTGAILAVPVAAAIMLIVREVIMPMQERS
ncbi:AI-2E family transporter [Nakamurella sp.]|uniref:AI-2E family transporter n=1 Tax=Nakamurella sp. TaxID=1869182 RepID=UPI003B3A4357